MSRTESIYRHLRGRFVAWLRGWSPPCSCDECDKRLWRVRSNPIVDVGYRHATYSPQTGLDGRTKFIDDFKIGGTD